MATNPDQARSLSLEQIAQNAQARAAYIAETRAALATRKATVGQLKGIAAKHGQNLDKMTDAELQEIVDFANNPDTDLGLLGVDPQQEFVKPDLVPRLAEPMPSEQQQANPLLAAGGVPAQRPVMGIWAPEGVQIPQEIAKAGDPTLRQQGYSFTRELLRDLGAPEGTAFRTAEGLFGGYTTVGGIGFTDFVPGIGAAMAVQEGAREFERGRKFDDLTGTALGAGQVLLGGLEAIPVVGGGVKLARRGGGALLDATLPARTAAALAQEIPQTALSAEQRALTEILTRPELAARRVTAAAPEVPPAPARAAAPEVPPAPARAAAPEVPPSPARAAAEPMIELTPDRAAAAERVLQTMDDPLVAPIEFAGNINLSKLGTKEDVSRFLNAVSESNDEFIEARRGVVPIAEIEKMSDKVSLESLLGRKLGQPLSDAQIFAAGRAVKSTSEDAIRTARLALDNPSDENLRNDALEAIVRSMAFQEQLAGGGAEIARALRVMQEVKKRGRGDAIRAVVGDITKLKDAENLDEILGLVADLDDPDQAAKFLGNISKPTTKEKILEGWINALLAGPYTHAVNVTSNALFALSKLPEEILASAIGKVTRSSDRITAGEVGARSVGLVQGTLDGVRAGAKVMRGEQVVDASKTELARRAAISGRKGQIVRLPSKALEVEDEFFKASNRRSELAAEAYRVASKEAKGDKAKFEELYRGYLNNPTDEMRAQADEYARYATFQNELTGATRRIQDFANEYPTFRFLVPFIRTPVNILKAARDRSLLAPLTRDFWKEVRAGGRRRDRALAKVSLGTGITGTIGYLYGQGLVTGGGPRDPGRRAALLATGWQPYSFKIGDTYYSYGRLEPISTVLGVSADFFSLQDELGKDEAENIPVLMSMSLAKNVLDKTFLQGISNFFEAMIDPDRYGEGYLEGLAASFVPNVLPQTARSIDPTLRETETFGQLLQSRLPFASEELPARLDAWGDEVVRVGYTTPEESPLWGSLTAVTNLLNPIRASQVNSSSPVKTEVARLGMKVSLPQKTISIYGNDVELTREEFEIYNQLSGATAKAVLDMEVATPAYQGLSDEEKRQHILDRLRDARTLTRDALKPDIIKRVLSE